MLLIYTLVKLDETRKIIENDRLNKIETRTDKLEERYRALFINFQAEHPERFKCKSP